ncbi:L-ribulose-5-phosphate 3-epimerase [Paraclostridium bifermentans]|uniref:L-ribulose-5-phosphate 3-epimerase n=1 Tax=Paraclostridium bifermentans TaxID=1490 RepID=UPI00242C5022|nr:L-ribulose-5-phosphate 3-epimerase [Paraclostridium bifermentans]
MGEYTLGLYEKAIKSDLTWEEKFSCAKESGFDFVEISIDETDEKLKRLNWTKEERIKFLETQFKVGIPVTSMCLSAHRKYPMGSLNKETREKSMDIMKKAIILANDIGIRIIQLAGYDVYYEEHSEETEKLFLENLRESVKIASKYGVILGFETMETAFMDTIEKAIKYVNIINSPYLKIYPDIGNLTNASKIYKNSIMYDLESGQGSIFACHLKDTVPGKYRDIKFGDGSVEFEKVIKKVWQLGVRRFTGEFWYHGEENWEDDIKEANKFLRERIDKAIL